MRSLDMYLFSKKNDQKFHLTRHSFTFETEISTSCTKICFVQSLNEKWLWQQM